MTIGTISDCVMSCLVS